MIALGLTRTSLLGYAPLQPPSCRPVAASSATSSSSPSAPLERDTLDTQRYARTKSNVLMKKSRKREQLEMEMQALVAQQRKKDSEKFENAGSSASVRNMINVSSKRHLKELVSDAEFRATVVMFGSPECHACMAMGPKMIQLAKQNQEILFAKVNTLRPELRDIAQNLNVPAVPWFLIFQGSHAMVASFTATLNTINVLRAEISNVTECPDPRCSI